MVVAYIGANGLSLETDRWGRARGESRRCRQQLKGTWPLSYLSLGACNHWFYFGWKSGMSQQRSGTWQTLTLLYSEWSKEIEPSRQKSTPHTVKSPSLWCRCCRNHLGDRVGLPGFTQGRWTQGVGLRPTLRRRCEPPAHRSKDSEKSVGRWLRPPLSGQWNQGEIQFFNETTWPYTKGRINACLDVRRPSSAAA